MSLKVTTKQIKKLLNHLLNNPLSGGVVGDVRDEACEIIATNIESHGSNTSLPSAAETDAVIGGGAIPNMVKSGGNMGIGEITSLRNLINSNEDRKAKLYEAMNADTTNTIN